ncbi:class D sortase [Fictibacillus gelatini]|uniref:class D sortase n=1 Tax=Fictibacillus gelatini TaxID=225985 RepID=UPI00047C6E98|nr:class D sortase [Fictibacillus gelatini]
MEKRASKRSRSTWRWIFLTFCIGLITFGVWFSTTNVYKFAKGYFAYKVHSKDYKPPAPKAEAKTPVHKRVEKEKALYPVRPKKGDNIGELYIPKLHATLPIFHGTNEDELEKGVGHFAGSVLPGERDNSVLAGHRDTVFRKLGEVGKGDLLIVTTSAGKFQYKVKKVRIVDKDDRTVIVPKPRPTLTVSTCYPFYYVGHAPKRYVLIANLVSKKLADDTKKR